jgi:hypothetical protein
MANLHHLVSRLAGFQTGFLQARVHLQILVQEKISHYRYPGLRKAGEGCLQPFHVKSF